MKRVFIIHGWGGDPDSGWKPWLKQELQKNDFQVFPLQMPNTNTPVIEEWVKHISESVGQPDKDTYLVGHSLGCQGIMRYLETLPKGSVVGGILLIAGFIGKISNIHTPEEEKIIAPWRDIPIDTEKVKSIAKNISAIFSPTDIWIPVENAKIFQDRLSARVVMADGQGKSGHFTSSDGVNELPLALTLLLGMTQKQIISIDDFVKLEIKIGTIASAEKVEGADKLLKLKIDFGYEARTIISGIAKHYQPEEIIGKQVPVITNLAPRKMKGIESQGMVLFAIDETLHDGVPSHKIVMLNPQSEVPPGSFVQ